MNIFIAKIIKHICRVFSKIGKRGQTAVEYLLMFAVIGSLCFSIANKLKMFLVGEGDCPNDSYFCKIIANVTGNRTMGGDFQRFRLRK
ncbi:MAG: hypothetical protein HQK51_00215 [Oligoflexia bacterium]|nr:hypothetical protein [Oligoflexia bacterium]